MLDSESPVQQISVPAAPGLASLKHKLGQSPLFHLCLPRLEGISDTLRREVREDREDPG